MDDITTGTRATIRIERDVPYGEGSTGYGSDRPGTRALRMDAYLPAAGAPAGGRPALVLSHGGAYHRGAKDRDEFEQDGSHNTPVHEYCERFAARGYACFSIGYRLVQEHPAPQPQPIRRNRQHVERGRIDFVRDLLGLPPATHDELLHGAEAAFADVDSGRVLQVVREEHHRYVDSHEVWGVPTFVLGSAAVFVRLLDRADGDGELARTTIDRILDMIEWPILNEFKHTSVPM